MMVHLRSLVDEIRTIKVMHLCGLEKPSPCSAPNPPPKRVAQFREPVYGLGLLLMHLPTSDPAVERPQRGASLTRNNARVMCS